MKIAIVSGAFFPQVGGVQVQVHNICNKLIENKIDVECFIFNKTNIENNNYKINLFNKFLTSFVFFFRYYLNLNLNFLLKIYLKKIIKKKYNFWHFNFLNHKCLILIECLIELKQKVIVSFHGIDLQVDRDINYGYRLDKKYEKNLKKILYKVNYFLYISQTIKNDLLNLNIPKDKLIFFPNSIEILKFKKYLELKKKNKQLKLITVARYKERKKGYDKLAFICKKLINAKIDFEWKIIGENVSIISKDKFFQDNLGFFKFYENIGNNEEVYFPHSSLIKHFVGSDLYINLSKIESFGITYIESLASLTPVLSFNSKGANEIVKNNYNGFLVNDENELIDKIKELSNKKNNLMSLENNMYDSIKKFDLNLVIDRYNSINKNFEKTL